MPKTITVTTKQDFIEENGGDPVLHNGMILLPSGATVTDGQFEERRQPPTDPWQLLEAKKQYWQERVKIATDNFEKVQSSFRQQAQYAKDYSNSCPPPPRNAKEILLGLKSKVEHARKELAAIDKELIASPQAQGKRLNREMDAERQQRIDSQLFELNEIQI